MLDTVIGARASGARIDPIVAQATARRPSEAGAEERPPTGMSAVRSPSRSVRRTRTPASARMRNALREGCPNRLPAPTLMSPSVGRHAAVAAGSVPFSLPWWATLTTSTRPENRRKTPSCARDSASPRSKHRTPGRDTSKTTLVSFVSSPRSPPTGHRTVTDQPPTAHPIPARRVSRSLPLETTSAEETVRAGKGSCTDGRPTHATVATPARPRRPPVWSSCA